VRRKREEKNGKRGGESPFRTAQKQYPPQEEFPVRREKEGPVEGLSGGGGRSPHTGNIERKA